MANDPTDDLAADRARLRAKRQDRTAEFKAGPITMEEAGFGPSDGNAAELQEDSACIVAGCPEPPVTHRTMKVSVPIMGTGSDGQPEVVNRQEQTIQAALCEGHNAMLKDEPRTLGKVVSFRSASGKID